MTTRTNTRYGRRPQQTRTRRQGPALRQVTTGQVEVAAWFLCICRVEQAARKEQRESLTAWALSSQMSAAAIVELAYAMAKADRRFGELQGRMKKAEGETVTGKRGAVLKMTDKQFRVVKTWGLILFGEPQGEKAINRTLGAVIGRGRTHLRTSVELLKRFLVTEDLEAFTAEFEAAGQETADDSNVEDLPTPDADAPGAAPTESKAS